MRSFNLLPEDGPMEPRLSYAPAYIDTPIYVKLPEVPNDTAAKFRDNVGIYEANKIRDLLGGLSLYSVKVEMELLELGGRVAAHGDDFPCSLPYGMYPDARKVEGVIE